MAEISGALHLPLRNLCFVIKNSTGLSPICKFDCKEYEHITSVYIYVCLYVCMYARMSALAEILCVRDLGGLGIYIFNGGAFGAGEAGGGDFRVSVPSPPEPLFCH